MLDWLHTSHIAGKRPFDVHFHIQERRAHTAGEVDETEMAVLLWYSSAAQWNAYVVCVAQ